MSHTHIHKYIHAYIVHRVKKERKNRRRTHGTDGKREKEKGREGDKSHLFVSVRIGRSRS